MFASMKPWDYFILALILLALFSAGWWLFGVISGRRQNNKTG